jgi:hypothetical protein
VNERVWKVEPVRLGDKRITITTDRDVTVWVDYDDVDPDAAMRVADDIVHWSGSPEAALYAPPAAHPPEGSPAWPYWVTCERQGHAGRAHYYTAGCQNPQHAPTPPPGPGQDGRHLPTHAVMWLVVNERICRKQHAPTEPHEWERATFSPAPEGE